MNIEFKTVIFPTYEEGLKHTSKKRILNTLQIISIFILATALSFIIGYISIYLGFFVPFLLIIFLKIYVSQKGKSELHNFKVNGKLIINSEGFIIEQQEKVSIPFDMVNKVNFGFDRADSLHFGTLPKAKTYKLIIYANSGLKTVYVDIEAELGYRKLYGNLIETLLALKQSNHTLNRKIQPAD